jgi:hypothetical protein
MQIPMPVRIIFFPFLCVAVLFAHFEACLLSIGNLLACPDGRLCYLDFGMMSYADRPQRNGFLLAVVHIVNRDWSQLVRIPRICEVV